MAYHQRAQGAEQRLARGPAIRAGLICLRRRPPAGGLAGAAAGSGRRARTANTGAAQELAQQPLARSSSGRSPSACSCSCSGGCSRLFVGHQERTDRAWKRAVDVLKAVIYGALGVSAFTVAMPGDGRGSTRRTPTGDGPAAGPGVIAGGRTRVIGYGANLVPGLDREAPSTSRPRASPARPARPTSCSARSATSPRASPSPSWAACSSTPRSPTTPRSPAGSTRRCRRC